MTMDTDRTEGRRVLLSVQLSAADSNTANVSEVTIYSQCQLLASVIYCLCVILVELQSSIHKLINVDCVQNKAPQVDIAVLHISTTCKWDALDHIIRKAFKVSGTLFCYVRV